MDGIKINEGTKTVKNSIIEFVVNNYTVFVFEGKKSDNDIVIKYKKGKSRIRTPRHIHWVVDMLMKLQGDKDKAKAFLGKIQQCWEKCEQLKDKKFETLKGLIENGIDTKEYNDLSIYGEYDVKFLYVLMKLLAVQEKTNREDAHMFNDIIKELQKDERDIFKIVSTAGFGGRRN